MNLIGKEVIHPNKYGCGTIVDFDGKYLTVSFKEKTAKFLYPDSFKKFLNFVEKDMQGIVIKTLQEKEEREQEAKSNNYNKMADSTKVNSSSTSLGTKCVPFKNVDKFYDVFSKELLKEMYYLKNNGGKKYKLFEGELINKNGSNYNYIFETDSELSFPDDTIVSVWVGGNQYQGTVIACEDFNIYFSVKINIGVSNLSVEISAEPWQLLEMQCNRLKEVLEKPSDIVNQLVCDGFKKINPKATIQRGQQIAVAKSLSDPIVFVWGPPGTGKTETLSQIAINHMSRGYRVLMLSYSNVSVDGAIKRVLNNRPNSKPGEVVRYGYPKDKGILEHDFTTSYKLVLHNHPELLTKRLNLIKERKKTAINSGRYLEINKELKKIKNTLASEEKQTVFDALFVATTVSKAIVDSHIYKQNFDVVIFDEASMAYIPQIVIAASLAKSYFCCVGDFCQLPPIVQSCKESYLNYDIFEYVGITSAVKHSFGHDWMVLLDTQFRMHSEISNFVSRNMYNGLLKTSDLILKEKREIANSHPFPTNAIMQLDLSGMMSVCRKTADSSKVNVLSAFISAAVATISAKSNPTGIITPYSAQSRLLRAMTKDIISHSEISQQIICSTVHQFQGSEKEVIIYDAVDCYFEKYPGLLLTSTQNNNANRLFNVAMTRSKGKFISISNVDYMRSKKISNKLIYTRILDYIKTHNLLLKAEQVIDVLDCRKSPNFRLLLEEKGVSFLSDLKMATKDIRIDIPGGIKCSDAYLFKLCVQINHAQSRGVKIVIRVKDKTSIPEKLRSFVIENHYITDPIAIIDKSIIWFGQPFSNADFIAENHVVPTKCRPVIRFIGKYTAKSLFGFLEMNRTVDQSFVFEQEINENGMLTFAQYVIQNKKCCKCGKSMKLIKHKGKFFLGCSNYPTCLNTELIDTDFVNDYLYSKSDSGARCPRDGTTLEAKLSRYGVYISCNAIEKHCYKLDEI